MRKHPKKPGKQRRSGVWSARRRSGPVGRHWLASGWEILGETVSRWNRNDGSTLAASMAYYAAFSFFPLLLVLISALGFALQFSAGAQNAQEQLLKLLSENASPKLAEEVRYILSGVRTQARINGPVGLITLLFGAIGIFTQLDTAFERLWHSGEHAHRGIWGAIRNALGQRLKAFLALIVLGLLVIAAFCAGAILAAVRGWAGKVPVIDNGWHYVQMLSALSLNAVVFTMLYEVMPKAQVRWRDAACGGLLVAILWQIGSHLLAAIVVSSSYSAYGVVGSFILMMLWVYCASTLIFFGAQFVQVLGTRAEGRENGIGG